MYSVLYLTRDNIMTVRFSEAEFTDIENASVELGVSKAEIIRRFYWTIRVLFSDNMTVRDVLLDLDNIDGDKRFSTALRNIPDLLNIMIEKGDD